MLQLFKNPKHIILHMDQEIYILSLNVRGLREGTKRRQLFHWLKQYHKGKDSFVLLQETHSTCSDEYHWQNEWGSKIVFDHGTSNSAGVAILFPMRYNNIDPIIILTGGNGRKLAIEIPDTESLVLLNIYSPTKDKVDDQISFIETLRNVFEDYNGKLILGGDFNLYLNPALDKYPSEIKQSLASNNLQNMMNEFSYVDIWRVLNPEKRRYTWRRSKPLCQSRLDYFLVPNEMIYNVTACFIKPSIKTDHSLISLELKNGQPQQRGPGLWKFNSTLLKDNEYVNNIKQLINQNNVDENENVKWDFIKMKIREYSIKFSKDKARKQKTQETELIKKLNSLAELADSDPSADNLINLEATKIELEVINYTKTQGSILRSKAQWVEAGEKNTKYFLNLEKRNFETKHITKLKINDNECTEDPKQIMELQKNFYKDLYSTNKRNDYFDETFLTNLPKISRKSLVLTETDISLNELSFAIKNMHSGKTPGSDGLTVDFYKFFWEDIKHIVHNSIRSAYNSEKMSEEQRRAVLRLIPKKDQDITNLKNWRPISLLNTDYKLIAQSLANRLQNVLPEIINSDQNGSTKVRFIGYTIRTIMDVIELNRNKQIQSIIAFLDFEKAFDKLNWEFIEKTLEAFGFGLIFRKWIRIMYNDISSCVINNGYTSQYFKIKCGIRQGCPLSALLFIIAVETLACSIRLNKNIKGVHFGKNEVKLCLLADDTTLLLADLQSLHIALNIVFMFHKSSGLKLNYGKTEVLNLGNRYLSKANPFNLKWVKEKVYALGTWFYKDINTCTTVNYEMRFTKFQNILKIWKARHLSWFGKITIIKTLALSKINYCIASLPTPLWFATAVQEEIVQFLWNRKPSKIKFKAAIANYNKGGIMLPNIDAIVKSQKAAWVKRLLNINLPTYYYLDTFLPDMKLADLLQCTIEPEELSLDIPLFYRQILQAWFITKDLIEQKNKKHFTNEILWFNKKIRIQNKTVFYKKWYTKGIRCLKDLLKSNNTFLSYHDFKAKYGIETNELVYMGFIDAVPKSWKKQLATMVLSDDSSGILNVTNISSRKIYWIMIDTIQQEPSCINSWKINYNISFTPEEWEKIFILPRSLSLDTKLQEFLYKIIHKIYASDSMVSSFDKEVSKLCQYCNCKNNIMHCFYECQKLKKFWKLFENWLQQCTININFNVKIVLFGYIESKSLVLNFCVSHAKWYIHKRRQLFAKSSLLSFSFSDFLFRLKQALAVEREVACHTNTLTEFDKKFNKLTDAL